MRYQVCGYKNDVYALFNRSAVPINVTHVDAFRDGTLRVEISFAAKYKPLIDRICEVPIPKHRGYLVKNRMLAVIEILGTANEKIDDMVSTLEGRDSDEDGELLEILEVDVHLLEDMVGELKEHL